MMLMVMWPQFQQFNYLNLYRLNKEGIILTKMRDKILNSNDIKEEKVDVPEWGVEVLVKGLSGKNRSEILNNAMTSQGSFDFTKVYPDLVIASSYDPDTKEPIFEKEDRDSLNEKSGAALERIASVVVRLSGLKAAAVDDAVKN